MKVDLTIDSNIRDWVLIPLVGVVFMVGVFRFYLTQYMNNSKGAEKNVSRSAIQEHVNKNVIAKCQKLVAGHGFISELSFKTRKAFYCRRETGLLVELMNKNTQQANPMGAMMNPGMMTDMLKNNLSMVVSTMGQFAWASYFFSGFVLAKVPFPLTQKFRGMLQRGVEISKLDVRYISSISLYFMILFGLSGLQTLLVGTSIEEEEEFAKASEMDQMKMQMPMQGGGMPGQAPDYSKIFKSEKENIEILKHEFALSSAEDQAISKLKEELKL